MQTTPPPPARARTLKPAVKPPQPPPLPKIRLTLRNGAHPPVKTRPGLIPWRLAHVFPCAENRFCLRHIHEHIKVQFRGDLYKELLWNCACATSMPYFEKHMDKLRKTDVKSYEWLNKIPSQHWSRAHFSGRAHCDMLLNNICKVFNRKLVDGRDGPLTPAAAALFKAITDEASFYKHAVAAMWDRLENKSDCGHTLKVSSCLHWLVTWKKIGRPSKKRKKSVDELSSQKMTSGGKLSRIGKIVTCDTSSAARGPQRFAATSLSSQRFAANQSASQRRFDTSPRSSQRSTTTPRASQMSAANAKGRVRTSFHLLVSSCYCQLVEVLRMISEVELQVLADLKSILYGLRSEKFGIEICVELKYFEDCCFKTSIDPCVGIYLYLWRLFEVFLLGLHSSLYLRLKIIMALFINAF
ncbi:hypothetical protein Tco_0755928 [Tanacetum coccineum]